MTPTPTPPAATTTPPPLVEGGGGTSFRTELREANKTERNALLILSVVDANGKDTSLASAWTDEPHAAFLREIHRRCEAHDSLVALAARYMKAHDDYVSSRPAGDAFKPWAKKCECVNCESARAILAAEPAHE